MDENTSLLSSTLHLHIPCHMMATATTTPPQSPQRLSQSGCEDTKDCYLETGDPVIRWFITLIQQSQCHDQAGVLWLVQHQHESPILIHIILKSKESYRSHKIKTNIDLFNDTCQYLASMVHGSNLTMQF